METAGSGFAQAPKAEFIEMCREIGQVDRRIAARVEVEIQQPDSLNFDQHLIEVEVAVDAAGCHVRQPGQARVGACHDGRAGRGPTRQPGFIPPGLAPRLAVEQPPPDQLLADPEQLERASVLAGESSTGDDVPLQDSSPTSKAILDFSSSSASTAVEPANDPESIPALGIADVLQPSKLAALLPDSFDGPIRDDAALAASVTGAEGSDLAPPATDSTAPTSTLDLPGEMPGVEFNLRIV